NISTDGCAFDSASVPLSVEEKILITISPEGTEKFIEARAHVVRADEKGYAIRFTLLEPESKTLIRNHFSRKMREK
ncbi:MAG: PilZ domain-containing protein, partial [Desulforhopalus sp.]